MYRSTFLKDFIDHNVGMWTTNNALTPDPDKEPDQLVSNPPDWPLLSVGLRMCGWGDHEIKFYLLGTALIWWGGAASLVIFVILSIVYMGLWQRETTTWTPGWFLLRLVVERQGRLTARSSNAFFVFSRKELLLFRRSPSLLPRLASPLLPLLYHGTCHLSSPLLPRPLLCNSHGMLHLGPLDLSVHSLGSCSDGHLCHRRARCVCKLLVLQGFCLGL